MRLLPAAALVALALLPAATADASVVVGQSIAGVKLGDDPAAVRDALGKPTSTKTQKDAILGTVTFLRFGLTTVLLGPGSGADAATISIRTTSTKQRTKSGVGVGTSLTALKSKVSGVSCNKITGGLGLCSVGKALPGRVVTDFRIKHGKVAEIDLGRVID